MIINIQVPVAQWIERRSPKAKIKVQLLSGTHSRARGSVGRVLLWHRRGQGFESPRVHIKTALKRGRF